MKDNCSNVFEIYREVFKRKMSLKNLSYIPGYESYYIGVFSKESQEGYRIVLCGLDFDNKSV